MKPNSHKPSHSFSLPTVPATRRTTASWPFESTYLNNTLFLTLVYSESFTWIIWSYFPSSNNFSILVILLISRYFFSLFNILKDLLSSCFVYFLVTPIWWKISSKKLKLKDSPMKWSDNKMLIAWVWELERSRSFLAISEKTLIARSSNSFPSIFSS